MKEKIKKLPLIGVLCILVYEAWGGGNSQVKVWCT